MPSTEGLRVFVRKDQLSDEEWFGLIEARRELIKPHLDSFTFPELSLLECMRYESGFTHLGMDVSTSTGDERFSLKTQGIFFRQPWDAVERIPGTGCVRGYPNGTMRVWGLTRSAMWVLVTICFVGELGYKERGRERASSVNIVEADLTTIIAETKWGPQRMWEELGKIIKGFAERRRALYDNALGLARLVQIEELALSLLTKD